MTTPLLSVSPIQINGFSDNDQDDATILIHSGATPGFEIFYESGEFSGNGDDILSAFFDLNSGMLTSFDQQVLPAANRGDNESDPSVAELTNGTSVLTYDVSDSATSGIRFQIDAGSGAAVQSTGATGVFAEFNPKVAALPDGGFVLVWEGRTGVDTLTFGNQTFDDFGIFYQLFDADGTARGAAQEVVTGVNNAREYGPRVEVADNGVIGIGYTLEELLTDGSDFFRDASVAQVAPNGTIIAAVTLVSDGDAASSWPTVTQLEGGYSLLTWRNFANSTEILGRLVDSDLNSTESFSISANTAQDQFDVSVTALPDGGFVASWSVGIDATTGERNVVMQRFDSDGFTAGDLVEVSTDSAQDEYNSSVVATEAGDIFVTWEARAELPAGSTAFFGDDDLFGALYTLPDYVLGTATEAADFFAGSDAGEAISLLAGADVYRGLDGDDTITGNSGNDSLQGDLGNDSLLGGIGFDELLGGPGDDTLIGSDGFDSLRGGGGDDLVTGNNGNDLLLGSMGQDTLVGGLGGDTLAGDQGEDLLNGQSGADVLLGGLDADLLNGNAGADSLAGEDGSDTLNGGINNDLMLGGDGDDLLNGNNGADTLAGGNDNDRLEGNAGADRLLGQGGDDVLRGGIGADTFVFGLGEGADRVADFQNNIDAIELDARLLAEETPVADDLRNYASLNDDGYLVLTFGSDSLTFTGVTNTGAILDEVTFF